ncbi:hypothetical protein CBS101457_004168 [Exobasidium rhododendri]|nr:hypothetical protein CBS101457_004168 [Exobasidium rhododendri]
MVSTRHLVAETKRTERKHLITVQAHVQEAAAFDTPDSFALRVKFEKHTTMKSASEVQSSCWSQLFIPVEPSTLYDTVLSRALSILLKSDALPPEGSDFTSFEEMHEIDAALFQGNLIVAGGGAQESMRYMEIDRSKQGTISKMGLKDGPEAVLYLGIRARGKKSQ